MLGASTAKTLIKSVVPRAVTREGIVAGQHIREGRFQRSLALVAGISAVLSGLEVTYQHYRSGFGQQVMYSPVILSPLLLVAGISAVFSRRAARVALPLASLVTMIDSAVGFYFHIRGIARKPGGWRIPVVNIVMGPPLLAPILFGLSGYLGIVASLLRREDDPATELLPGLPRPRAAWLGWIPQSSENRRFVLGRDIREGRFQRHLAAAAALTAICSGFEALYSHYKNDFAYWYEWTPIALTPVMAAAGFGTIWSKTVARTLLPLTSVLLLLDGTLGSYFHVRGVLRRPGGRKLIVYNIIYGPPIFAPLLFAASGFMGLLASLLRRED
jgi:hypothetical protein